MNVNVLLLCGGNGAEHAISLISASYVEEQLRKNAGFNVVKAIIDHETFREATSGELITFNPGRTISFNAGNSRQTLPIDAVVPCLHGFPGETGDIQSFLRLMGLPCVGCDSESSRISFNKVLTKLCLTSLGIPNSPFIALASADKESLSRAHAFFNEHQDVYVKAASQGSSIGCYHVSKEHDLEDSIVEAFSFSRDVLIEKTIPHRELEVAAYVYQGQLHISTPGEIIMPDNLFYTYEEKYSQDSGTVTTVTPAGLTPAIVERIQEVARRTFQGLKMQDLSRIDFFLTPEGEVLVNEPNTFPGMTPISMFPKLVEHMGLAMSEFFRDRVLAAIARQKAESSRALRM